MLAGSIPLSGQNYSISTNAADWLALGTINVQGSMPVSRHTSLRTGAAYNPFTFGSGEKQKYFRRVELSFGARYWPWFVNSGWYLYSYAAWAKYALGGIFTHKAYEGYAYGAKLGGGYALMLDKGINLAVAMREACAAVGGEGGGHKIAAGGSIPSDKVSDFMDKLDSILEQQLSSSK